MAKFLQANKEKMRDFLFLGTDNLDRFINFIGLSNEHDERFARTIINLSASDENAPNIESARAFIATALDNYPDELSLDELVLTETLQQKIDAFEKSQARGLSDNPLAACWNPPTRNERPAPTTFKETLASWQHGIRQTMDDRNRNAQDDRKNPHCRDDFLNSSIEVLEDVQRDLSLLGFNAGSPDGVYGSKTARALKAFQKAHDLEVTGVANRSTISSIQKNKLWHNVSSTLLALFNPTSNIDPASDDDLPNHSLDYTPAAQAVYKNTRDHMIEREGRRNKVYIDSEGFPTVGIGHLVLKRDNLKVGDVISDARIEKLFKQDFDKAFNAAFKQSTELKQHNNPIMIKALLSVNFQLGTGWTKKWKNTWGKLKNGDWESAVRTIGNSKWSRQTPVRTRDFIAAIKSSFESNTRLSKTPNEPITADNSNERIKTANVNPLLTPKIKAN